MDEFNTRFSNKSIVQETESSMLYSATDIEDNTGCLVRIWDHKHVSEGELLSYLWRNEFRRLISIHNTIAGDSALLLIKETISQNDSIALIYRYKCNSLLLLDKAIKQDFFIDYTRKSIWKLILQLAKAIIHLHASGRIHGNLTENVFLDLDSELQLLVTGHEWQSFPNKIECSIPFHHDNKNEKTDWKVFRNFVKALLLPTGSIETLLDERIAQQAGFSISEFIFLKKISVSLTVVGHWHDTRWVTNDISKILNLKDELITLCFAYDDKFVQAMDKAGHIDPTQEPRAQIQAILSNGLLVKRDSAPQFIIDLSHYKISAFNNGKHKWNVSKLKLELLSTSSILTLGTHELAKVDCPQFH